MAWYWRSTSNPILPFAVARVHFEHNVTDGDVEVVFEVKGGDEGLAKLAVVSPDGRTVIYSTAPDASTLGIRQFRFESPEPRDIESLKSAYPEGAYTFAGATAAGNKLYGQSRLNNRLPATATFLRPGDRARGVVAEDVEITWTTVKNIAGYILEIKQDELDVNITAKLPGSAAAFAVPAGFLITGTQYKLSIGTVTDEGNIACYTGRCRRQAATLCENKSEDRNGKNQTYFQSKNEPSFHHYYFPSCTTFFCLFFTPRLARRI